MKNRHKFNRNRNASRLLRAIEKYERELINSRQSWQEWIYLHNQKALILNGMERG